MGGTVWVGRVKSGVNPETLELLGGKNHWGQPNDEQKWFTFTLVSAATLEADV